MTEPERAELPEPGQAPAIPPEVACRQAIAAALQQYGCEILPQIAGEPVGHVPGKKLQLEAVYQIVAIPRDSP